MKFSLKGFGRRLSALVLVVSLLLPTTGCMQQEQEKSDGSVPYEVLVPYPVTVLGERFEQAPERIISLSPVLTRLFYDFGLEDALIGITDNTVLPDGTDSADLLRVGTSTSPDIDMILEANPNFIISMFELPEFETKKIESAGIPILVFPQVWDLSGLETLYRNLGLMFSGAGSNRKTERHVPRDPKYLESVY